MVIITCRNCGRMTESSTFTLDPIFGKMVCAQCVKDRKKESPASPRSPIHTRQDAEPQKPAAEKPMGWDEEDEYLERHAKDAKKDAAPVARRLDDAHVQLTCPGCNYSFKYDFVLKHPGCCPYCSREIPKFRLHNS